MKQVTIQLLDNLYRGDKVIQITDSDYILVSVQRYSERIRDYNCPALYILLGPECKRRQAYVGQTSNVCQRFKQHAQKKDFWEEMVIIKKLSRDFTRTEIEWLESQVIQSIVTNNNFDILENYQIPTNIIIDEKDRPGLCECFETIKLLLEVFGCPLIKRDIEQDDIPKSSSHAIINRIARSYKYLPYISSYEEDDLDDPIQYKDAQYLINSDGSVLILEKSMLYGDTDKYKNKMIGNQLQTLILVENEEQAKLIIG